MKAKLIKKDGHYFLEVEPNTWTPPNRFHSIIANTLEKIKGDILQLSLSNCQAIECGYDLDELAREMTDKEHQLATQYSKGYEKGIVIGFQKALELMGDKKFSEEDLDKAFELGKYVEREDCTENYLAYKQSLQQTEWDVTFNPDEKDSDGCLILKRL